MGWNYRKSVNLGGGFRLNFSKSGAGISGGVKGFRISSNSRGSRLYASIPGTGIYYTKSLSSKRNANNRSGSRSTQNRTYTNSNYQYSQTVTNEYTGETRDLRARTQFELNQLVELETRRQSVNEQRQRQLEAATTMTQQAVAMNQQLKTVREELSTLINHTLSVNDRLDWNKYMIMNDYPPMQFNEKAPIKVVRYKLPFFKSLFMNEKKFEVPSIETPEMKAYEARRNAAISDYLKKKSIYDKEKNLKNGEMTYLRKRFEEADKDAIERYVSIVLTNSKYPVDFEHDFEISYDKEAKTLKVNFLFQDIDSFPVVERYEYNPEKNEIVEIPMSRENAISFYSNILYSVGIRTIHEIFESVYIDAIDFVSFNGYISDENESLCAFSLRTSKSVFEKINLRASTGDILKNLEVRTIGDFTKREQIIPL